jgi:hypothetical protein
MGFSKARSWIFIASTIIGTNESGKYIFFYYEGRKGFEKQNNDS